MVRVLTAGVGRSGSTWLHHASVALLRQRYQTYDAWCAGWDEDLASRAEAQVRKVHAEEQIGDFKPDLIMTSHRDLRDVALSLRDYKKLENDEEILAHVNWARQCHEFFAPRADIDVAYERIVLDPIGALTDLARVMGIQQPDLALAKASVDSWEPVAGGKKHRFDGRAGRWREQLHDDLRHAIEEQHADWLAQQGYAVTKARQTAPALRARANLSDVDLTLPSDDETMRSAWLREYPPPPLFSVVSWGYATTSWIARALNSHPDVFCVHDGVEGLKRASRCSPLSAQDYLEAIGSMGSTYKAAGDVRGVTLTSLPALRAAFPRFEAAVVVREPLARFLAHTAAVDRWAPARIWDLSEIDAVCVERGLPRPRTYRERLWVHAAQSLNAIVDESAERVFRCEDLMSSAEHLAGFVSHLTGGEIEDLGWAADAVGRAANSSGPAMRSELTHAQLAVLRAMVKPEAWAHYESLGYEIPAIVRR